MKYAFIDSSEIDLPISRLCDLLEISRSGFYDWRARVEKPNQRALSQEFIGKAVRRHRHTTIGDVSPFEY